MSISRRGSKWAGGLSMLVGGDSNSGVHCLFVAAGFKPVREGAWDNAAKSKVADKVDN